jgi:hypothetical protein
MIIPVATRTQEGAQKLLDTIKRRAFMAEEISLPLKKYDCSPAQRSIIHYPCTFRYAYNLHAWTLFWHQPDTGFPSMQELPAYAQPRQRD